MDEGGRCVYDRKSYIPHQDPESQRGVMLQPMSVVLTDFFARFHARNRDVPSSSNARGPDPTYASLRDLFARMHERLDTVDARLQQLADG